ncbi:hypothetical protein [Paraburkholderia sp. J8-2]|uniref:hypothetical protein n=1 Tax=Paraburkholderia sp. J8-2 TaxID=2805440 RepID=UPI002AB706F4|nr:hypothetical protein [Paraburkholderia sp. J8-2]
MAQTIVCPVMAIKSATCRFICNSAFCMRSIQLPPLSEQQLTLPDWRAYYADFASRPPRGAQQFETLQLLRLLTVLHVTHVAEGVIHLARINEPDREAAPPE